MMGSAARSNDMSNTLSDEIAVGKGDGIRVVMLLNYLPIHFLSYLRVLSRSLTDLTFLLSETMDASREWSPDFGELKVIVQKSIPIRTKHRHPYGFEYKSRMLIPVSTFSDLRKLKPEVVVSLEVGARTMQALVLKCLGMKYRLIVQVRESEISALYRGGLRMRLRKWILPRVDRVLVNGESGRRHVMACGVRPEKISVVASGTDLAVFGRTTKSPNASGSLRVLYVGALIDLKGIVGFARVLADEVSRSEISVEWTLVGRGPERETLEQIAWPANLRVSIIDSFEYQDLPAVYEKHDVFVMPSLCDEWGMVVNEAMVSGLPVLGCTGSQAVEEMVTPGLNGWTYAPGDEQGMRLAVRELLRLDQGELMTKGMAAGRTAHEFSDEKIAGQMLQAIRMTMAAAD
jgi:glycosyltransferase involved in cell wall biosynthesis